MPNAVVTELATALRVIGMGSSHEAIEIIERKSPAHAEVIERILEHLPSSTTHVVYDTVMALTNPLDKLEIKGDARLRSEAFRVGNDPRNFREAAVILETISDGIPSHSELDERLTTALELLESKRALGLQPVRQLARFLVAIRTRPNMLRKSDTGALVIADEYMVLHELQRISAWFTRHSDLWGLHAAEHSRRPELIETFGASTLPKVRSEETEALVLKEPALVLLPGRSLAPRWIRVDSLPAELLHPAALEELRRRKQISGIPHARAEEAAKVLWAAMHIVNTIMDDQWFAANVLVEFQFHPEPRNLALFDPKTGQIHVWGGPLSPWAAVHEFAHVVDHRLVNGNGMASETEGHPLNAFTDLIRPYYREGAEKLARGLFNGTMKRAFGAKLLRQMKKGLVPLDTVLSAMTWIEQDRRDVVRQALVSDKTLTVSATDALLGEIPNQEGLLHGPHQVLYSIQETLVEQPGHRSMVNLEAMWEPFLHRQLQYLLSNRELFARFFDHYARLLFDQQGKPYGPRVRPGDAPEIVVANNAGHLLTALREAQLKDWMADLSEASDREVENTLVSAGLALGMLAMGAGFIAD